MTFGGFTVRLDGWDVDYGAEMQADFSVTAGADDGVDLGVEYPAGVWAPVDPLREPDERTIAFIDGVRRLEARLIVQSRGVSCYGAFGSYGVGCVVATPGREAQFADARFGRHLIYGSGELPDWPVRIGPELEYQPLSTPDPEPDGPLEALHAAMRRAEAAMTQSPFIPAGGPRTGPLGLPTREIDRPPLIVCDGPLQDLGPAAGIDRRRAQQGPPAGAGERRSLRGDRRGGALGGADRRRMPDIVGLIKRVYKLYVPESHRPVLARLGAGQRTPVFLIGQEARARYSWFLRLAAPGPAESDMSGLVRLEVSARSGLEVARRLADEAATRLPAFAPSSARDPRAPQNLMPFGALEDHLRHQMGDARLIRRKIVDLIAG
ncbi:hypothetical protein TBR22_A51900 [Luteitalea sp. TBR-22]|uniref:hypothetical protein n=1 Tax=Luteitalea sp. TBR-22 TaxID=2802971 RepID=UPI001AFB1BD5|nr:hypothetical protein [Luteitalea sp. TBR-22]BCS35955.1 hypothetical protein TBR22_A51900 [Luteitalea sp. TBR-22]